MTIASTDETTELPKQAPLKLQPPKVVENVEATPEDTSGYLPDIPEAKVQELSQTAKTFSLQITQEGVNSPAYKQRIQEIENLAAEEVRATSSAPSSVLQRRSTSVAGSKRQGLDATQQASQQLTQLRAIAEDLSPNPATLTGATKILGFIPGGNKLRHYFQRYESAQGQINGILNALHKSEDTLREDNAALAQTQGKLWNNMIELHKNSVLLGKLDDEISAQIRDLQAAGDTRTAKALDHDVLFVVRQRRQDILAQLAIAEQSYMIMDVTQESNRELVRGVVRSRTSTVNALENAMLAAQTLANQELVLDQVDAIKRTTEKLVLGTSQLMKKNGTRVLEMSTSPAISLEVLQQSFQNITDTIEEVDNFKATANSVMDQNIRALDAQAKKVQPLLDRAHASKGETRGSLTV